MITPITRPEPQSVKGVVRYSMNVMRRSAEKVEHLKLNVKISDLWDMPSIPCKAEYERS